MLKLTNNFRKLFEWNEKLEITKQKKRNPFSYLFIRSLKALCLCEAYTTKNLNYN